VEAAVGDALGARGGGGDNERAHAPQQPASRPTQQGYAAGAVPGSAPGSGDDRRLHCSSLAAGRAKG
jgi:hypothetical protein